MPPAHPPRGLRLLSLDGGGIRGMSTLLILKQIMYLLQQRENLPEMPVPCQYFDLIGGTSTGGIIAIMLGRLRMPIDDAIECYEHLSKTVFGAAHRGLGAAKFDHKVLERVIKDVVKQYTGNEDTKMFDNRENACKIFVCARMALNMNSGHLQFFRTYISPIETTYDCQIWEAARATSATPSFFKCISIGGHGFPVQPYIDGGLGANNPIRQVLEESHNVFPNHSVACIVSIGTGQKSTIQIPNPGLREHILGRIIPIDAAKAAVEIATDCEQIEQMISKQFRKACGLYYRFNVDQGMQSIDIADFDKVQNVAAHTESYMKNQNVTTKLGDTVLALCERKATILTSQITGSVIIPETHTFSSLPYNIPVFRRALHFIPRTTIQQKLNKFFHEQQCLEKTTVVSLIGMGGAGKTQLALEYCNHKSQMNGLQKIFWIDATSQETVYLDMKNIAKLLDPSCQLEDTNAALKHVKKLVSSWTDPWLMIFDNLDDPSKFSDIPSLFPHSPLGAILITSRHRGLKELSPYHILLQEMDETESFDLLLGYQPSMIELEPAKQILEQLGWLPLALDQARAYISKQGVPLQTFIKEFDDRKNTVLQSVPSEALWSYKRKDSRTEKEQALSVYTTWEMSLLLLKSSVGIKFPQLQNVLTLLAFFHPHAISQDIFSQSIDEAFAESPMIIFKEDNRWNHVAFEETIATMQDFSLLQFAYHETMGVVVSMHALVSEWLRMRLEKVKYIEFIQPAMNHLAGYLESVHNFKYQRRVQSLLHVDRVLSFSGDKTFYYALAIFARFYQGNGQLKKAERLVSSILTGQENVLGPDHRNTLITIINLGSLYRKQGQLEAAQKMYERALTGMEKTLGSDHMDTLTTLNNLGQLHQDKGQFPTAQMMYERTLTGQEKILGPDHKYTLTTVNNLGVLYFVQGQVEAAEKMYERALIGREKVLGPDHLKTLTTVHNLARLYQDKGQFETAQKMYSHALIGKTKALGPDHIDTLIIVNSIGSLYQCQRKFEAAQKMYEYALTGQEKALGPDHIDTLFTVNNLGSLYQDQGMFEAAQKMYERALTGREKALGPDHVDTLATLDQLLESIRVARPIYEL